MKKEIKVLITLFMLIILLLTTGLFVFWSEKNIGIELKILNKNKEEVNLKEVEKGDFIQINFTSAVNKQSVEKNFNLSPKLKTRSFWVNKKTFGLEILEPLKPETDYSAEINNFKSKIGLNIEKSKKVNFSRSSPPKQVSFFPKNDQKEVDYTINPEIILNKSLSDDYFLKFKVDPYVKINYKIKSDGKKFVFIPEKDLMANTKYKINIILKNSFYEDFEKELYRGNFTTKKPSPVVYSFNKDGEPLKTEERSTLATPQITEGKYIDIDLSNQFLSIFQNGKELGIYKVSTGKIGMDTPVGKFKVMGKAERPWSKDYELFMPWFIQFTNNGHGIHELPEWPGGAKEGWSHLGIPVSHGCVRLGVGPAKKVYDFAEIGTPIVIHY